VVKITAEDATSPEDPRLTAYEAGRWYALNGRPLPGGASRDCAAGYYSVPDGAPDDSRELARSIDEND
jgi:hypothetical protein